MDKENRKYKLQPWLETAINDASLYEAAYRVRDIIYSYTAPDTDKRPTKPNLPILARSLRYCNPPCGYYLNAGLMLNFADRQPLSLRTPWGDWYYSNRGGNWLNP
jgi:hypothetical protein